MLIQENLSIQEKLKILTDAAKYDVACTSSGVKRKGKAGSIGNTSEAGICHSFAADGRCISLLKILFTNQCIYDCKYCVNRCSNDVVRTAFTPDEVCKLTIEFYRRNYIEGLFLSSGILYNANHTMELIYETLYKLRNQWNFNGYIHVKAIPGADAELVERTGFLADRMSINLELPTAQGLKDLAPGKTRDKILAPMRQIQQGISVSSHLLGYDRGYKKPYSTERAGFAGGAALIRPELAEAPGAALDRKISAKVTGQGESQGLAGKDQGVPGGDSHNDMYTTQPDARPGCIKSRLVLPASQYKKSAFVPAGQSTQMIVGATPENDYQMMSVTQALYQNFGLKRVFYSAYIPVNEDSCLPSLPGGPPLLREHRLYQADWLLRFYGFRAEELLSEDRPNFNVFLDPKCDWALRHLEGFPVEVNLAPYDELLRVPGMGVKSASRIVAARRSGRLGFEDLKKMGVVLKRARYFITCSGRMMEGARLDQDYITNCLVGDEQRARWDIEHRDSFRQLSLFDDMHMEMPVTRDDHYAAAAGHF
ncbi:putative DNA modification/repair radical SAM protein [Clostridiales bacterium TF09-2AC]|nr:putative DNA modification/repair radical SAM protein [Clostridiales bacterium TF09-2AC]